jgi:prepilin-type N-terminal cleavage/methylation domain-containing protein/prepilin-type processing-associated H-X9-DG protein
MRRQGISLVEVLIVIAIIAVLIQLSLPAVQMARESARRTQCQNHLRQIGLAIQQHEVTHKHYPAGGWGYLYVGDPDRGYGREQPGGWIFNVLPYLGEQDLHDMSAGLQGDAKIAANSEMMTHAVKFFGCPSRRKVGVPLPFDPEEREYGNYRPVKKAGKSDFAGNAGELFLKDFEDNEGPPSYDEYDNDVYWLDTSTATGIFFQRSMTRIAEVTDGLGHTYFVGEKYVDPLRYTKDNTTAGDDQCMYVGADSDIIRWAAHEDGRDLVPIQDKKNFEDDETFGAAHPAGCNFLMGDGSVQVMGFDIDATVHRRQANKSDGDVVPK